MFSDVEVGLSFVSVSVTVCCIPCATWPKLIVSGLADNGPLLIASAPDPDAPRAMARVARAISAMPVRRIRFSPLDG